MTQTYPTGRRAVVPTADPDSAHLTDRAVLQLMLDRLSGLPEALRQTITDHQWSMIPLTVDEYGDNPAAAVGDGGLVLTAQTSGLELITSVVVSIPAGSTAVLQLGAMRIPIGVAGTWTLAPLQKLLGTSDVRKLTLLTGGPGWASLSLNGQQMPTYGVLAH